MPSFPTVVAPRQAYLNYNMASPVPAVASETKGMDSSELDDCVDGKEKAALFREEVLR